MSIHFLIMEASAELLAHAERHMPATQRYLKSHGVSFTEEAPYAIGAYSVAPVIDCGNMRFEFGANHQDAFEAFVFEVLDWGVETVIDLAAWPMDRPDRVMSMFGRAGLLRAFEAMNPATYILDYPLIMHRTPLEFMQAGFRGSAVVDPYRAAWDLFDVPGRIAAHDQIQAWQIHELMTSIIPTDKICVASAEERRAAA
jgi:hypothetical protein